ncbi:MAG: hypothetical protein AAGC88_00125 [Bacteroidota bacterium]
MRYYFDAYGAHVTLSPSKCNKQGFDELNLTGSTGMFRGLK